VGGRGVFVDGLVAALENETNIQLGMLRFDEEMLGAVLGVENALGLNDDAVRQEDEIRRVGRLALGDRVADFQLLVVVGDASAVEVVGVALLQARTEPVGQPGAFPAARLLRLNVERGIGRARLGRFGSRSLSSPSAV
jgi:hypothetical protein